MTGGAAPIASFVLGGGSGTRLWPLSREDRPKQFHALAGPGSMLGRTVARLTGRPGRASRDPIHVIAASRHAGAVATVLGGHDLRSGQVFLEPVGRSTGAAVALAAEVVLRDSGGLMLVVPSDHRIGDDAAFWRTVEAGVPRALAGDVVLFGIVPDRPETGFGYIETAAAEGAVRPVARFVEKPDRATAEGFLAAGTFFWNAGIFLCRADVMRDAFALHAPAIQAAAAAALARAVAGPEGIVLDREAYASAPAIAVDRAVIERIAHRVVVPAEFGWSDLGSWQALAEAGDRDAAGTVVAGDVVAIDCRDSYLRGEGRLVAAAGLSGLAVVATADAVLVAPLADGGLVGRVVAALAGRPELRLTPVEGAEPGAWRDRVRDWLARHGHPAVPPDGTPETAERSAARAEAAFDPDTWTVKGEDGTVVPADQFRAVAALAAEAAGGHRQDRLRLARRLYVTAAAGGIDRRTGLVVARMSADGAILDGTATAAAQAAAIVAALALGGSDFAFDAEARIAALFRHHIDPAPDGAVLARVDRSGAPIEGIAGEETIAAVAAAFARYLKE